MTDLDGATLQRWLLTAATRLTEQAAWLTALDAAIGDGDHGHNMARGFQAVAERVAEAPTEDLGALLKLTGTTLISTVGGAAGPLYGTAFLRAGAALAGRPQATAGELAAAGRAALAGISARGKATAGEKTMIDALLPAIETLEEAVALGADVAEALTRAADAAARGARATIPLVATKGRASYLGERSVGHQDPGAASLALLLGCLAETVAGES
jgi:dihydroxyacetone kinase-like protein